MNYLQPKDLIENEIYHLLQKYYIDRYWIIKATNTHNDTINGICISYNKKREDVQFHSYGGPWGTKNQMTELRIANDTEKKWLNNCIKTGTIQEFPKQPIIHKLNLET